MKFNNLYKQIIAERSKKSKQAQAMKNNPTTSGTAALQSPITVNVPAQTANQNYRNQVAAQAAAAKMVPPQPVAPTPPRAAAQPQPAQPRAIAQPQRPDMISKIAAAPVNALTKGIGAYSRIVNAPRALGQALKSAAGGAPQQLQQQIAGAARRGGITAATAPGAVPPQPAVQQNVSRVEELIQRIRKNPNDQQAISALRSLKS